MYKANKADMWARLPDEFMANCKSFDNEAKTQGNRHNNKGKPANNAKPAPVTDLQQSSIENRNQNANLNRKKLAKEEEQVKVVVDSTGSIV